MGGEVDHSSSVGDHKDKLPLRLANDVFAAAIATCGLAPFVTTVDKSIISNASGRQPLGECAKENLKHFFTKPISFISLREFRLIYGTYCMTYISANITDTLCRANEVSDKIRLSSVFVAATATNMCCGIAKDAAFTRMFGTTAPRPLPFATYFLFATRDALTVLASFVIVEPFSKTVYKSANGGKHDWGSSDDGPVLSKKRATQVAQVICPVGIQCLSTPFHLYGLDLYNRPGESINSRVNFMKLNYLKSVAARVCRIAPAFGFGGIGNTALKAWGKEKIGVSN